MILKRIRFAQWRIYAACDGNDKCQLLNFLINISPNMVKYRDRLLAIFDQVSIEGPQLFNDQISHQIDQRHGIWEFIAGRIRVLWFYDNDKLIVCSNAFIKDSKKTPKSEKQRAISFKAEYFRQKDLGKIHLEKDS